MITISMILRFQCRIMQHFALYTCVARVAPARETWHEGCYARENAHNAKCCIILHTPEEHLWPTQPNRLILPP